MSEESKRQAKETVNKWINEGDPKSMADLEARIAEALDIAWKRGFDDCKGDYILDAP